MTSSSFSQTRYGLLADSRSIVRLEDVCVPKVGVQTGPFGSQLHNSDYADFGVPIITVEHIGEHTISGDSMPLVKPEDAKRLDKYSLKAGDIVFSRVGSVDRSALVSAKEEGWLFSGRLLRVRPSADKIDSGYLSYFFQLPRFKTHMRSIAVGATMPSLNTSMLKEIEVVLPNLVEQRIIRQILEVLDAKLANNKRLSKTLEDIAQTIFQSWFIDFDPVKAKMAGEKPVGMDTATAALFPDSMEDSELGLRPKGWSVGNHGDVFSLQGGFAFKSTSWVESGVPVVKIGSVKPGFVDLSQVSYVTEQLASTIPVAYQLESGSLVIGLTGYVGQVGLVRSHTPSPLVNQRVAKFKGFNGQWRIPFTYCITRRPEFKKAVENAATGTAQQNVSNTQILAIPTIVPPLELREYFDALFESFFNQIVALADENDALVQLRDALLPRLISGELQIPEEMLAS